MILDAVRNLYNDSIRQHGPTPPGVGWKDTTSQDLRFSRLMAVADGDDDYSIADLGCGYGALYEYLIDVSAPCNGYTGYDISSEMLAHARDRLGPDKRVRLVAGSAVAEPADFVVASGIFNVRMDAPEDEWSNHIWRTVEGMAAQARKGFAFNLLTTFVDFQEEHLYYADPGMFLNRCRGRWPRVTLYHDYPLYEWTITVRHR